MRWWSSIFTFIRRSGHGGGREDRREGGRWREGG